MNCQCCSIRLSIMPLYVVVVGVVFFRKQRHSSTGIVKGMQLLKLGDWLNKHSRVWTIILVLKCMRLAC